MSAKNTTFAAKFNKNLPIMSYISVAQYASSEDTKKTAPKSSLFCIVEKVLRVLKVLRVILVETNQP